MSEPPPSHLFPRIKNPCEPKIESVKQLYSEIASQIYNAKCLWGNCVGEYRVRDPTNVEVLSCPFSPTIDHGTPSSTNNTLPLQLSGSGLSGERHFVHQSIIAQFSQAFTPPPPIDYASPSNSRIRSAVSTHPTRHIDSILFWLKLRNLLQVHTALSSMGDQMCNLRATISGLHTVTLMQTERIPGSGGGATG